MTVLDSVFRSSDGASSDPLSCYSYAGAGAASLSIDYDDLALPPSSPCAGPGSAHYIQGSHNLNNVDPQFADAGAGDYTLTATSPVRQLDPPPLAPRESPLDLFGRPANQGRQARPGRVRISAAGSTRHHAGRRSRETHCRHRPRDRESARTDTTYLFTYGLTTRYGHRSATVDGGPGGAALPVSAVLHGLRPGRTYHYGLIGRRLAGARRALRRAHCRLGRVSHHHGSPGRVIAQDPSHGHRYGAGHRVSVTIGHS